mgnify:CR=1 FL=1
MRASHALRWLAGGVLVLWCGVFLRMETTEKSMVRALIVQPNRSGWAVQLLYQFPEAAADASDAVAEIRSCSAEDATLPLALHKAERELPKAANYRLCEYLLFDETASQTDILELEEFLQTEPVSRLSARVLFVAGIEAMAEETLPDCLPGSGAEETDAAPETLPGALLQAAEDTAARAPHLYECAAGAVIPILKIEENRVTWQKESCLLTAQGYTRLSPNEMAMAQLLQERTMPVEFALEGETVTLRRCVVSVEADGDGFVVTLTGQRRAGTPPVAEGVCRQLEALCEETILRAWQSGADLLRLGAVRALKEGPGAFFTTKNACPEVRASVKMLDL